MATTITDFKPVEEVTDFSPVSEVEPTEQITQRSGGQTPIRIGENTAFAKWNRSFHPIDTALETVKEFVQSAGEQQPELSPNMPFQQQVPNLVMSAMTKVLGEILPRSTMDIGELIFLGGGSLGAAVNKRGAQSVSEIPAFVGRIKKVIPDIFKRIKSMGKVTSEEAEAVVADELSTVIRAEDIAKLRKQGGKLSEYLTNEPMRTPVGRGELTPEQQEKSIAEFVERRKVPRKALTPEDISKVSLNERAIQKEKVAADVIEQNKGLPSQEIDKKVFDAFKEQNLLNKKPETPAVMDELDKGLAAIKEAEKKQPMFAGNINLDRMNLNEGEKQLAQELWTKKAGVITHADIEAAAKEAKPITKVLTDAEQLKILGSEQATREQAAALIKRDFESGTVTKETIEALKAASPQSSFAGRLLEARKIIANPILNDPRTKIIQKLVDNDVEVQKIIKAAEGIDWNNGNDVTRLYRQFIKPTAGEIIKTYRYGNMLSGPLTTIKNTATNLTQALIVHPMTKTFDATQAMFKSTPNKPLFREIPTYYRGYFGSLGDSFKKALDVMSGKAMVMKPDLEHIPTNAAVAKPAEYILKFLEAQDVIVRNSIAQGEMAALVKRGIPKSEAALMASKKAERLVFRNKIDPTNATGQGKVLTKIDQFTNIAYQLRRIRGLDWVIPFVETPMNILKSGLEYSPLGLTTLPGAVNKPEQISKVLTGSLIFGVAAYKAMEGKVTGPLPKSSKDREYWEMRGIKPWSMKIGDNWYSLNNIGPVGYPFAMAVAIKDAWKDSPTSNMDSMIEKTNKAVLFMGNYFADQSYMKSVGDLVNMAEDEKATVKMVNNFMQQMVPFNGMRTWMGRLTQDIRHKSVNDFSMESFIQNLAKDDPFFSKYGMPMTDLTMQPLENKFKTFNAFSPVSKSVEDETWGKVYDIKTGIANKLNAQKNQMKKETKTDIIKKSVR